MRVVTAAGQDAAPWTAAIAALPEIDPLELLGVAAGDRVVVVVPHPDDETLALGGTLQRLARAGVDVGLVVVTDGAAAYTPDGPPPAELAGTRRAELGLALARLGAAAEVTCLGLPDGGLAGCEDVVREGVEVALRSRSGRTVLLATWEHDPHPDHQAVGRAALAAARATRTDTWAYPVWMRHRHAPDDPVVPWDRLRRVRLDDTEAVAKQAAIAAYRSQITGPSADIEAVLPDHVLAHFADGHELLLSTAPDLGGVGTHFDDTYAATPDPWSVRTSWYERRKRAALLSALPRERYGNVWEPGCSIGLVTAELARRSGRVEASDVSPRAVQAAQESTRTLKNVRVSLARLPDDPVPYGPGECELVVLSEVLYYLDAANRTAAIDLARRVLPPGGHLVVVHWRAHPSDAHCSGDHANAEVVQRIGSPLVHHVEEYFVLDVFEVPVSEHRARDERGAQRTPVRSTE